MLFSPDSGEWFAQLTLDEEQKLPFEYGPKVGGPWQVPVRIKGEVAARLSIFYEEEGKKVKVSSDVPLLQAACEAPMSMKTSNWVVCSVDMPTRRGHSVSLGGHFICCEF